MKHGILAARTAIAIEKIADELHRISGNAVSFQGIRGNTAHRHLFMLERIANALEEVGLTEPDGGVSVDDILALDGLSVKSRKAIQALAEG